MSDDARQTPGEPESRDPWAPPEDRPPQPAQPSDPSQPSGPSHGSADPSAPAPEVSLDKQQPAPDAGRDPWAPPAPGGSSVHQQPTVASMPGAPGYGYPTPGDAVPPPPVAPDGPGQAPSPYATPGAGHPGYPGYPGYPGQAGPGAGAPGYGWAQLPMQPSNGMGVTSLVLGIVAAAIFCLWPIAIIVGILAIIFGAIGRGKAKRGEATNPGQALAGLICGIVGVVLGLALLIVVIATAADDSSGSGPDVYEGLSVSQIQMR